MIPSAIVELESLPLTPNGKVDRQALPKPSRSDAPPTLQAEGGVVTGNASTWLAPRTPTEEVTAEIWSELLNLEQVGANDNFFELGGDSLLVMQAIVRLNRAFEVDLPVGALFEHPTVAALSAHIEGCRHTPRNSLFPDLIPVPRTRPMPVSAVQEEMFHGYQNLAAKSGSIFVCPLRFHLQGPLQVSALERALTELFRRHEILRTTFRGSASGVAQIIGSAEPVNLPVVDLTGIADPLGHALRLADEDHLRPLDLMRGPLLRPTLLRLYAETHRLLLTVHHIVYDPRALEIMFAELGVLYDSFCRGKLSPLPEPPLQNADVATWQRRWLHPQHQAYQQLLAFWKKKLAGAPTVPDQSFRRSDPASPTDKSRMYKTIRAELYAQVNALARREGATFFMTALAAMACLLHECSQQTDLLLTTLMANRTQPGTDGVLGIMANPAVLLRLDLSGDPSYRELLDRVRHTLLEATAHQDLPFPILVRELQQQGQALPEVRLSFAKADMSKYALPLSGLQTRPLLYRPRHVVAGLGLGVVERGDRAAACATLNPVLYDPAAVRRLLCRMPRLLEQIVAAPQLRLSQLLSREVRRAA
jgi:acyl carrier protein